MAKKTLNELVFHDDFMFTAVMLDEENCRCFLERVLEIPIERVEQYQKNWWHCSTL